MSSLPEFSRAAVLRKFKDPLAIEEVLMPRHVGIGAALVKIDACSICGTDVHLWQGELSLTVNLPVIIGHEMVGTLVELGHGVEQDSVGNPGGLHAHCLRQLLLLHHRPPAYAVHQPTRLHVRNHGTRTAATGRLFRVWLCFTPGRAAESAR